MEELDVRNLSGILKRNDNVVKPESDKREYRGLELSNRLKVMLVSDSTTEKSAAALDVNVGGLSDPEELPGLAHFCEHMLFLGTEKYPQENEYAKFLSEHGGEANAVTSLDHTTYKFDVLAPHLGQALDIFAQFFIAPLFTESATERELNAVHSEYELYLGSDQRKLFQLMKALCDKTHPFNKFPTGNRETLETIPKEKGIDVKAELMKFHKKWYSSNVMTLIVLGKESLDDLEAMVVPLFSAIEDLDVTAPSWPIHPYPPHMRSKKVYYAPLCNVMLTAYFPLPDLSEHYKSKPTSYITNLLDHKGPGSLIAALNARGWSTSIDSGTCYDARGFLFYMLEVDMTESGLDHIDDIVKLIFQYLAMLRSVGTQQWVWEERNSMLATNFRFTDAAEPIVFVNDYVHYLQHIPMEDILSNSYLIPEWKPDLIKQVLALMTPENILLEIVAKRFAEKCTETEPWYGAKYCQEDIDEATIKEWSSLEAIEELHLPPPNEFIPARLEIEAAERTNDFIGPIILQDTEFVRIWFKQDIESKLPQAFVSFALTSPLACADEINVALTALWGLMMRDRLLNRLYASQLAGMSWGFGSYFLSMDVTINGYDDKLHVLLELLFDEVKNFKVDPERFEIVKENYLRILYGDEEDRPVELAQGILNLMLYDHTLTTNQKYNAVKEVTPEELDDFAGRLLKKCHIEGLIYGNMTEVRAKKIAETVEKIDSLDSWIKSRMQKAVLLDTARIVRRFPKGARPVLPHQLFLFRSIELDEGSWFLREIHNSAYKCSCATVYYACGLQDNRTAVLLELLIQTLAESCYNTLRTQEQLGYSIYVDGFYPNGAQGLTVKVEGEKHPEYLESRIEVFIANAEDFLQNMSESEFQKHRAALWGQKAKKPQQMVDKFHRLWNQISSQVYNFCRSELEIIELDRLLKDDLIQFYKKHISASSPERRKISIHVISTAKGGAGEGTDIKDESSADKTATDNEETKIDVKETIDENTDTAEGETAEGATINDESTAEKSDAKDSDTKTECKQSNGRSTANAEGDAAVVATVKDDSTDQDTTTDDETIDTAEEGMVVVTTDKDESTAEKIDTDNAKTKIGAKETVYENTDTAECRTVERTTVIDESTTDKPVTDDAVTKTGDKVAISENTGSTADERNIKDESTTKNTATDDVGPKKEDKATTDENIDIAESCTVKGINIKSASSIEKTDADDSANKTEDKEITFDNLDTVEGTAETTNIKDESTTETTNTNVSEINTVKKTNNENTDTSEEVTVEETNIKDKSTTENIASNGSEPKSEDKEAIETEAQGSRLNNEEKTSGDPASSIETSEKTSEQESVSNNVIVDNNHIKTGISAEESTDEESIIKKDNVDDLKSNVDTVEQNALEKSSVNSDNDEKSSEYHFESNKDSIEIAETELSENIEYVVENKTRENLDSTTETRDKNTGIELNPSTVENTVQESINDKIKKDIIEEPVENSGENSKPIIDTASGETSLNNMENSAGEDIENVRKPVKVTSLMEFRAARRLYPRIARYENISRKGGYSIE